MSQWYIYLDDERKFIPEKSKEYLLSCQIYGISTPISVNTYSAMIEILKDFRAKDDEVIIDLDHDLGEQKTGYDVCKWIVEEQYPIIAFHLHTMNPVGRINMQSLLKHYGYIQF